ncbi:UNVERIFIED_CONTAM: hypothetical protein Slati_1144800 [Sesamum latifolium]|uniref:SWIM-type domain-containing protein n=1 Tax=Sesamum latifolium TaxID=2727402 RepID=A0AAW2XFQ0_9LAMI
MVEGVFDDKVARKAATTSPQAVSVIGPRAISPWLQSVSCAAYLSRRHSIVLNVPFPPCAAPLWVAGAGWTLKHTLCPTSYARLHMLRLLAHMVSSPDLLDAEHTVGMRPSASVCPGKQADDYHYEIMCFDGSRVSVYLARHSCACKKWDLTGISCKHALGAVLSKVHDPEDYVYQNYKVETFLRVYAPAMKHVNGPDLWKKTVYVPPLPPNFGRGVGRPPKARRREDDELVGKQKKKGKKKKEPNQNEKTTSNCKV